MKLETQELNRCLLKNFILQNTEKCKEGLQMLIVELRQKPKVMRKEMKGIIKFLKNTPFEKLMRMALLNKKALRKKFNSSAVSEKQRALYLFASHKSIKPVILEFREEYPNWKDTKGILTRKTEPKQNEQVLTDVINVMEAGETGKSKKKIGKKSLKKKKIEINVGMKDDKKSLKKKKIEIDDGTKDDKKSLKKKKIEINDGAKDDMNLNAQKNEQVLTDVINVMETGETEKSKKKIGKKSLKKKKIETDSAVVNGSSSPKGSSANEGSRESQSDVQQNGENKMPGTSTAKGRQGGPSRLNMWQKGRGGKFSRPGNFHKTRGNRGSGFRGQRNGSWRGKPQSGWKQKKFPGRDNPNNISVPSDWQNRTPSTTSTEGQTASLLKPSWLTNPEERKPTQSYGGRRNFGKREPANANMIHVSSEWKNKSATSKSEEGQTSSLLRPDWLTNPQERKPAASFNKSRGNFKRGRKR